MPKNSFQKGIQVGESIMKYYFGLLIHSKGLVHTQFSNGHIERSKPALKFSDTINLGSTIQLIYQVSGSIFDSGAVRIG